jgi:hypothetical protein
MSRILLDDAAHVGASTQLALQTPDGAGQDERSHSLLYKIKQWAADLNSMTQELLAGAVQVSASRSLTAADNGATLECTAITITLTVPAGLAANFGCAVIPKGTTSIASAGGALLNGATSTITRADSANSLFAVVSRASAADSYVVTGS